LIANSLWNVGPLAFCAVADGALFSSSCVAAALAKYAFFEASASSLAFSAAALLL